ncbi:MAG: glutamine synthetase, partial [Shewanella sp.]
DLPAEVAAEIPQVATSLENALENLQADHEFLTRGGVFSEDFIQSYIALKSAEAERVSRTTHPLEFEMYYSL